ncbi:MAG: DNA-binding protein [Geodermatophilaceae bacterium]|nr:DNA-binding protein [Geodermatophilaceae bacterium]
MEFIFILKYQLSENASDADALVERLGVAGCDDAVVGIGQPGRLALEFTRDADSAEGAIRSALEDVRRAIPSARLIEVSPDLVGLTDVADLVGVSRQHMRKLMLAHGSNFPPPVHAGSTAIWHLVDLLTWLQTKAGYATDRGVLEVAAAALQVNVAKEVQRLSPATNRGVAAMVG